MDYQKEYERLMDMEKEQAAQTKADALYREPRRGHSCPHCGYCPHCGRGGNTHYWPYYPNTIYCSTGSAGQPITTTNGTVQWPADLRATPTSRIF